MDLVKDDGRLLFLLLMAESLWCSRAHKSNCIDFGDESDNEENGRNYGTVNDCFLMGE